MISPMVKRANEKRFEVGRLLCSGLPDKEIGAKMHVSKRVVKDAIKHLCREFSVERGALQRIRLAVKLSSYPIFLVLLLVACCSAQWFSNITIAPSTTICVVNWNSAAATQGRLKFGPTTSYGSFTSLETTYQLNHSATLSGLTAGTVYHFVTLGKDTTGVNPQSKDQICTTTAAAHSVSLNWNASTTAGVTYRVYRSLTSGSGYAMIASALTGLSYLDIAVANSTTYYYVTTAFDGTRESVYSNEAVAVIP